MKVLKPVTVEEVRGWVERGDESDSVADYVQFLMDRIREHFEVEAK